MGDAERLNACGGFNFNRLALHKGFSAFEYSSGINDGNLVNLQGKLSEVRKIRSLDNVNR